MTAQDLNPRVQASLKFLATLEHLTGDNLEHAIRFTECITPEGNIDVAKMHPDTENVLREVIRRRLEAGRPVPVVLVDSSGRWNKTEPEDKSQKA